MLAIVAMRAFGALEISTPRTLRVRKVRKGLLGVLRETFASLAYLFCGIRRDTGLKRPE